MIIVDDNAAVSMLSEFEAVGPSTFKLPTIMSNLVITKLDVFSSKLNLIMPN